MYISFLITAGLIVYAFMKRGDLLANIARITIAKGNTSKGYKWLEKGYKMGGMSFENKLTYAFMTFKNGNMDKANMLYNLLKMENKKPEQVVRIKASQALIYWKQKDYKTAIEMLEEVLEKGKNSVTYGSLGLIYFESGNLQRAMEVNQEAYEYNPDDMVILDNYASSLFKSGDLEKAEEIYLKLHEKNPHFPEAYLGYGKLLIAKDEHEKGIKMIEEALTKRFQFTSTVTYDEIEAYLENLKSQNNE